MTDSHLLVTGHSHITCLGIPLKNADGDNQLVAIAAEPCFHGLVGAWPREKRYWEQVIALTAAHRVAISWMGNQHNSKYMLLEPPGFDFMLTQQPDLPIDLGVPLVPEQAVRESFAATFLGLRWMLGQIAQRGGIKPVLIGTPPPKGDNDAVRALLARERHFVRVAEQMGASLDHVAMSAPLLRVKLWRLLQQMMAEIAAEHGLAFWPTPSAAEDAEGFLRREYWSQDATHANAVFGKLMLRDMERRLLAADTDGSQGH